MRVSLPFRTVTTWRHFWIMLFAWLLCVVVCDRVGGIVLNHLQRRVTTGDMLGPINNAIRAKADILILGTSRAKHGYDDRLLSELLQQRVFNAASGGSALLYAKGIYGLIRKTRPPKTVILDVGYFPQERERIHILDSFYGQSPDLDELLIGGDWRQRVKLQSHLYRYNGFVFPVLKNFTKSGGEPFGFQPLFGTPQPTNPIAPNNVDVAPDPAYLGVLTNLVDNVARDGGTLIFVESPHLGWPFPHAVVTAYEQLAQSRNIPFIHLTPTDEERHFFRDPGHVNAEGAKRMTVRLAEAVRSLVSGP
jgi:hypothetical protein